jgi:uncharacterized protein (TIGR02453 family)
MADFAGFSQNTIQFLEELSLNNNRTWFEANRQRYEQDVREPALAFIEAIGPGLHAISPELTAVAKKSGGSLMRIHRDLRFSRDDRPYKTNVGIQFRHRAGADVHAPGMYVHIQPGESFLAAGLWRPDREPLDRIRAAIAARPEEWFRVRDEPGFAKHWKLEGESLTRPPQGYAADTPAIEDIKRKDFIGVKRVDEEEVLGAAFLDRTLKAFAASTPMMRFLCDAVGVDY